VAITASNFISSVLEQSIDIACQRLEIELLPSDQLLAFEQSGGLFVR
jgi:hypothetical protein